MPFLAFFRHLCYHMWEEVNGLDTKAKKRVWLSGILGVVVLLILGVVIYFANDPWGFARQVSAEEREAGFPL